MTQSLLSRFSGRFKSCRHYGKIALSSRSAVRSPLARPVARLAHIKIASLWLAALPLCMSALGWIDGVATVGAAGLAYVVASAVQHDKPANCSCTCHCHLGRSWFEILLVIAFSVVFGAFCFLLGILAGGRVLRPSPAVSATKGSKGVWGLPSLSHQ